MPIRVALRHVTSYRYDRPVQLSPQVIRLRPAPHCRTPVLSYSLRVTPAEHFINWQQDPYSNYAARVVFHEPARELRVEVDLVAEMTVVNPFDFFVESQAEKFPFAYDAVVAKELIPYLDAGPAGPRLEAFVAGVKRGGIGTVDYLVELNRRVQQAVGYVIRLEPGVQTCEETLSKASGSCRDSAWLLVQVMRRLGIAARFVSGYLIQLSADVAALDGPSGPTRDFTDLHAWAEAFVPGAGWIGLDPTSGLLAGEGHLPLACSAEPITAAPITGSYAWTKLDEEDQVKEEFGFEMEVQRVHEDPRVTKPYTQEQWAQIEATGRAIDAELMAGDVRLTMGGEPTFVSIDDYDGDEWNTAAMGPMKRRLAGDLLRRLHGRFASGGLLHFGQGKWYPGESLPRWSLTCYWRRDGQPIWRDPALIASDDGRCAHTPEDARRFLAALAERLGLPGASMLPGFEDVFYYLWKERRLPVNVDPHRSRLRDPQERARLSEVFERGLDRVVGYALPLRRGKSGEHAWVTGAWFFRPERMYLLPGDSPMGLRLPLDSLPWVAPGEEEPIIEVDPMAQRDALAPREQMRRQSRDADGRPPAERIIEQVLGEERGDVRGEGSQTGAGGVATLRRGAGASAAGRTPEQGESAPWIVRTALCVEPRDGTLRVFLPPLRALEDYLELIAAVEETAAALGTPVMVEGYPPPQDHRIELFRVTPDPGVIEVNVQPAGDWDALVRHTTTLYDEARQARLGAEKFMLDGRHTGTGGGNHIVLGGPTPADSPFLRRPDLLSSLLGYWHNHPSLSYLFSGLFIGPTSQAPRVDEARHESAYELEIALGQVPEGGRVPPWLVDRVFRHLLVDLTGNTHRAEFCIDKLYSPDSSSGRLGLLELRAFEMPPHAQMSLTQQLLLRALIARFWRDPYRVPLARWGTELHDRFMLPHFVMQDFDDVIRDVNDAGGALRGEWFAPHAEFRFPWVGEVTRRGVKLELRTAIEPWHVLGEESAAGGVARYVDSSVERLQVKVEGLTDLRHVVTCNGRRVPLHPTGVNGQYVAGVRFRAWRPASCLHPNIDVHTPLVFDLLDTWAGRSIGGCTYHVSHPGGRAFATRPVNAFEAESRRAARFFATGHTPGRASAPDEAVNAYYPLTLDLRRPIQDR